MDKYIVILLINIEQEEAIKQLFQQKQWVYYKTDLGHPEGSKENEFRQAEDVSQGCLLYPSPARMADQQEWAPRSSSAFPCLWHSRPCTESYHFTSETFDIDTSSKNATSRACGTNTENRNATPEACNFHNQRICKEAGRNITECRRFDSDLVESPVSKISTMCGSTKKAGNCGSGSNQMCRDVSYAASIEEHSEPFRVHLACSLNSRKENINKKCDVVTESLPRLNRKSHVSLQNPATKSRDFNSVDSLQDCQSNKNDDGNSNYERKSMCANEDSGKSLFNRQTMVCLVKTVLDLMCKELTLSGETHTLPSPEKKLFSKLLELLKAKAALAYSTSCRPITLINEKLSTRSDRKSGVDKDKSQAKINDVVDEGDVSSEDVEKELLAKESCQNNTECKRIFITKLDVKPLTRKRSLTAQNLSLSTCRNSKHSKTSDSTKIQPRDKRHWPMSRNLKMHSFHRKCLQEPTDLDSVGYSASENGYYCKDCKYVFWKESKLKLHKTIKGGFCTPDCIYCDKDECKEIFQCSKCPKCFSTQLLLDKHTYRHLFQRFKCRYCELHFHTPSSLRLHTDSVHQQETKGTFLCDLCGKKFSEKKVLNAHRLYVHTSKRPEECDICGRGFKTKSQLKNHLVVHKSTSDFNLSCEICGKMFVRVASLKDHVRRHKKEYSVFCHVCGKGFYRKSVLEEHARSHTGLKPFECEVCNYKCALSCNLVKHMKVHKTKRSQIGEKIE